MYYDDLYLKWIFLSSHITKFSPKIMKSLLFLKSKQTNVVCVIGICVQYTLLWFDISLKFPMTNFMQYFYDW